MPQKIEFKLPPKALPLASSAGAAILAAVFGLVLATRLPFAPRYLYHFDSVNFALALEHFNPAMHQPQPPGYPLFVFLTKLIHIVVPRPEAVFIVTGIMGATVAVFLLCLLAQRLFGWTASVGAALLLLFNPVFSFASLANPVRVFLAVIGPAVALAAWNARRTGDRKWFYATALLLGTLAGFRPEALALLLPVVLLSGLWGGARKIEYGFAAGLLAIACIPWVLALVIAVGGPGALLELLAGYAQDHSRDSSLFGAGLTPAALLAWQAVVWNFLGGLAWIWAVPFAARKRTTAEAPQFLLLGVWFVPAFLFQMFAHIRHADQALITIPALCVAGGWALSRMAGASKAAAAGLTCFAVIVNIYLFARPLRGPAFEPSLKVIRIVEREIESQFNVIRDLEKSGPVTLIWNEFYVSWRHLTYYFPNATVLVIRSDPRQAADQSNVWAFRNRKKVDLREANGALLVSGGAVALVAAPEVRGLLTGSEPVRRSGSVLWTKTGPGAEVKFGSYTFHVQ